MNEIIKLLKEKGPLTGKELLEKSPRDALLLWRFCNETEEIYTKAVGKRYLRLDKRIQGFARLSPSILREFLTYTVIGLNTDFTKIEEKAKTLLESIEKISREKFELSKEIISQLFQAQKDHKEIEEKTVFIIAGDVVYNMAHSELRPEVSTGEMVKGSDLDIIIVTEDLSEDIIKEIDQSIYKEKYYLIKRPAYREELDYIIKDMRKVENQLHFNSFEFMVASKLLHEGKFLYGSMQLFENIKKLLQKKRIPEKLAKLENIAIIERVNAKSCLLNDPDPLSQDECTKLFYTKEEAEEIF